MIKNHLISRLGINIYKNKTVFNSGKVMKDQIFINDKFQQDINILKNLNSESIFNLFKLKDLDGFFLNIILGLECFDFEEINLLPQNKEEIKRIFKVKKKENKTVNLIESGFNFKNNRWKFILVSLKEEIYKNCFQLSGKIKRPLHYIGLRNIEIINLLYFNNIILQKEKILDKNLMIINVCEEIEATILRSGTPFLFRNLNYNSETKNLMKSIVNRINMISELFYLETGEEIHLYLILLEEDTAYNISYLSRSFKKPFISINKLFENRIKGREKLSSKDILSIIH